MSSSDLKPQEPPPLQPPPGFTHPAGAAAPTTPAPSASQNPDPTPPPPAAKKPDTVIVPSYSRWFTWNGVHSVEVRQLPEFFDGKSPSKNPGVYKYYRNAIVRKFRENPSRRTTFTEARRTVVGDVGSIRRVFDFLDTWGLINYPPPPSSKHSLIRWGEERESKSSSASASAAAPKEGETDADRLRKWCRSCKAVCSIACFVCNKFDLVLCARCYVRGNYGVNVTCSDFRRVEISEQVKTDWTDKETLQLLEAIMHYGDDWKRVAEHVAGRSEKECVARFIKLPFGEQFVEPADHDDDVGTCKLKDQTDAESAVEPSAKRQRLTPLADASNPIMAQAAFLSALAGIEVSEAAAQAAVATLYDTDRISSRGGVQSQAHLTREQEPAVALGGNSEEVRADAEFLLKQEEDEYVKSISTITEVQMKEILDKLACYEQMELQLERERHQLHQMKHQLFLVQLSLLFHKSGAPKSVEHAAEEHVGRTELTSSS